jgi:hypothetical protein
VHRFNDGAADAKGRLWSVSTLVQVETGGSGSGGRLVMGGADLDRGSHMQDRHDGS